MKKRCGSPSFPGYPTVPLPRSQLPARSPCTWPASHSGGVLLCAWRYCPPLTKQEGPDDHSTFGIHSRGFGTRSIRFVRPLRVRDAMFASERLPTFLGWEWLPTGYHLHVSSSFRWIPHAQVAGAMVNTRAIFAHATMTIVQPSSGHICAGAQTLILLSTVLPHRPEPHGAQAASKLRLPRQSARRLRRHTSGDRAG